MTSHPELLALLASPFEPGEIKRKAGPGGRSLSYVTARQVMNRLDTVLGPENWWDEYVPSEQSVLCRLSIRLPDGTVINKADAGGYAGMADSGDDDKSGFSDAFKRAAVKFGIGRHLYGDGIPSFSRTPTTASAPAPAPAPQPAATIPMASPADFRPGREACRGVNRRPRQPARRSMAGRSMPPSATASACSGSCPPSAARKGSLAGSSTGPKTRPRPATMLVP